MWPFSGSETEVTADGEVVSKKSLESLKNQLTVTFINMSPQEMDVFWDDGSYGTVVASNVASSGGRIEVTTFLGHGFSWTVHGRRQQVGDDVVIKAGVMEYVLPANVNISVDKSACQDRHRRCPLDARNGECIKNPGWMIVNCPVSCSKCEMLDPMKRCDRKLPHLNMSDTPSWGKGDLNRLFEDIMTNAKWAKYSPTAVSRPPAGPWIVTFEDMIEDEESAAMIASVSSSFERSTDTGASNEIGEAQKVVSTVSAPPPLPQKVVSTVSAPTSL
jgi:hypothetical protein